MANVSFYRQTTGSTATGAITFDTTNKYIYLGDGSTAYKFDCNNTNTDTKNTAGSSNTSSKIYLIGATSQSTSGVTTYSHDTAYVGADGYLYGGSSRCLTRGDSWTTCNYNYTQMSSVPTTAKELLVSFSPKCNALTEGKSSRTAVINPTSVVHMIRAETGMSSVTRFVSSNAVTFFSGYPAYLLCHGRLTYGTAYDSAGGWAWNGECLCGSSGDISTWSLGSSRQYGTDYSVTDYDEFFSTLEIVAYRY